MTTETTPELPPAADKTQPIVSAAIKLREIARRITDHLKRFENDKSVNSDGSRFFHAGAWAAGRYVQIRYVSFQGESSLTKQQASDFLAWLDAGNVGKHWKVTESR